MNTSNLTKKQKQKAKSKFLELENIKPYQVELLKLQKHIEEKNLKMIILVDGRDAAGKGGFIRSLTRYMNEKHYQVVAKGKPTKEEQGQYYYQKYVGHFPDPGQIVIFDRSWYNRAMVEKVFGFCTQKQYDDFMKGVKNFEKDLIRQGTILVKLYFSVTKEEQSIRFDKRHTNPLKEWKLSEIDRQAQDKWDEFTETKYQMLKNTSSGASPTIVIRSNDKPLARTEGIKAILNSVDYDNRNPDIRFSHKKKILITGARELEIMVKERHKKHNFQA